MPRIEYFTIPPRGARRTWSARAAILGGLERIVAVISLDEGFRLDVEKRLDDCPHRDATAACLRLGMLMGSSSQVVGQSNPYERRHHRNPYGRVVRFPGVTAESEFSGI